MYQDKCNSCCFAYKNCPASINDILFAPCLGEHSVIQCKYYKPNKQKLDMRQQERLNNKNTNNK